MYPNIQFSDKEREYHEREAAFAERIDCLCECIPVINCDCSKCPAQAECQWLCQNEPYRNAGK